MNALDDLTLFAKLVELKSFTAVAESLHLSRSSVSKRINRLEARLGVQLVHRTTRRLELTEAGRIYHQYCLQIEQTLHEAETAVSEIRAHPQGQLNINAPFTFGQMVLSDIIAAFLKRYPAVNINLSLSDAFTDIVGGGFDLAVRIGELDDSSHRARRVGCTSLRMFAHKDYLKEHGTPREPEDLRDHNCLIYRHMRSGVKEWRFSSPKGEVSVPVHGNLTADTGMPLYRAVKAGLGIAIQPGFMLEAFDDEDIVYLLEDYMPIERGIYAVYPSTKQTPLNTRVFIDFLAQALNEIEQKER